MKKLIIAIMALAPMVLWAQENNWELTDEVQSVQKSEKKQSVDAKYLRGAVPLVDGKVVFNKHIDAPGKSADQVYDILADYMTRMTKASNQIHSTIAVSDREKHEIGGAYEEWLVFKKSALSLDRTRLYFILKAVCSDGGADVTISHIRYLYEEERDPQRIAAEEWITDREAVNKKNTKLLPLSGKFRRKTIDRKDFLFNKFESLLK